MKASDILVAIVGITVCLVVLTVVLSAQEIGIVSMLIATVFGISPPSITYFQQMRARGKS